MAEPVIARRKPFLERVEKGKAYFWCRCGRSQKQPFCDGSHKGTEFTPLKYLAEADREVLFCACKHTADAPFCDGTHNNLSEHYAEADDDGPQVALVDYQVAEGGSMKARLDGDCYVIRVPEDAMRGRGNLKLFPVIGGRDNARFLSQFTAVVETGQSPPLSFSGSDTALFAISGEGRVLIGGHDFPIGPESGLCIKSGEAFAVVNLAAEPILLNLSACPSCPAPQWLDEMPTHFDQDYPQRLAQVDEARREKMADRFFQVLVDQKSHGTQITQFIGEIPQSRAAHHRHLYEETLTILSGEGFMWTDNSKAPVRSGDTIFLPLKQHHSLECTTPGGMKLVGVFYPSGSPAINY